MASPQRVHPTQDPEAPTVLSSSLVSDGASKSKQNKPADQPKSSKRRGYVWKCLCWTSLLLIVIIMIMGILAAIVYFVYQPKIPNYSIDSLNVRQFNLEDDMSLYAVFNVNISLSNPNKKIGIYYEGGSDIKGFYQETQLCQGSLPKFYQGHRNTTVLDVVLSGQKDNATAILQSLLQQQQTGSIPLDLRVKVPVRIELGFIKLMTIKFSVKCKLVVNSLSTNKNISLKSSDCKFKFRL